MRRAEVNIDPDHWDEGRHADRPEGGVNWWIWIIVCVLLGAMAVAMADDQLVRTPQSWIIRMLRSGTDSLRRWLTRVRPGPNGLLGSPPTKQVGAAPEPTEQHGAEQPQREEAAMAGPSIEDLERELRNTQERLSALEVQAKNSAVEQRRLRGELRETVEKLDASRSAVAAQLAPLRQQLEQMRTRIEADRAVTDRIQMLCAAQDWLLTESADQAELVPEDDVSHFRDPDAPEPGAQDTDPAEPAAEDLAEDDEVSLIRVSLYRLRNAQGRPGSGTTGAESCILIERTRISLSLTDYRDMLGTPPRPGSHEPSVDALFDAAAEAVTGPGKARFDRWTEFWQTPVSRDFDQFAQWISLCAVCYHELVLGMPVKVVATRLSVPQIAAKGLSAVAAELTLPADSSMWTVTRLIRFTGVAVGFDTGQPVLANACLKSLAHDWLSHQVSHAIAKVLHPHPHGRSGRELRGEADRMDFWSLSDRARAAEAAGQNRAAERRALLVEMRRSEAVQGDADAFSLDTRVMRNAHDRAQYCLDRGVSASRLAAARRHVERARAAIEPLLAAARKRLEAECAAVLEHLTDLGRRIDWVIQQTTDADRLRTLAELNQWRRTLSERERQPIDRPADLAELRKQCEQLERRLDALCRDMDLGHRGMDPERRDADCGRPASRPPDPGMPGPSR
jgi:predicted  nucleic acid-binding Zn-ribbon protein